MKKLLAITLVTALAMNLTACASLADAANTAGQYVEMAEELDEEILNGTVKNYVDQAAATIQESAPALMDMFYSTLSNGVYWVGAIDDKTACNLFINDKIATLSLVTDVDGVLQKEDITGKWTLDYENLTIEDADGNVTAFGWTYIPSEDGVESEMIRLESDDLTIEVSPSAASSQEEVDELTSEYLENAGKHEEYKTLCEDYEGFSVVNALFAGGEIPTFARRAEIAKSLGIENYVGSAEQNLQLIELCGGTVVQK